MSSLKSALMILTLISSPALAQNERPVHGETENLSYQFGVCTAQEVRKQFPQLHLNWFVRGFKDALASTPLLNDTEISASIAELKSQLDAQQSEVANASMTLQGVTDALSSKKMTESEAVAALAALQKRVLDAQASAHVRQAETSDVANATAQGQAFRSRGEKLSYGFGVSYANTLRMQSPDMDPDAVLRGLNDTISPVATSGRRAVRPQRANRPAQ